MESIRVPIRVLIADGSDAVRHSLRILVDREPDMTVVGEANDGDSALDEALRLRPDVALLDIQLSKTDGIEVTRLIRQRLPDTRVIVMAVYDSRWLEALMAGASHFLLKDSSRLHLLKTVRNTASEMSRH